MATLAVAAGLLTTVPLQAQGDGPRAYQNVPQGTHALSLYGIFNRGNRLPDPGSLLQRATIDVDLVVAFYTHPLSIAGRAGGLFAVLPAGEAAGTVEFVQNSRLTGSSSGIADLQLGIVHNLVGSPSLPAMEFAAYDPGFSLGILAKVTVPTGDYASDRVINMGANRWALQLGVPITQYLGISYLDPKLTTLELFPSVTFFTDNDDPFAGDRREQDPIFRIEGHVTRNLSRAVWVSLDGLFIWGGETTTDGLEGNDAQEAFELGGTVNLTINRSLSIKASYGEVVKRNDEGPDGSMIRMIGTWIF